MNIEDFERESVSPIWMYIRSTSDIPLKCKDIRTSSDIPELGEMAIK